MLLIRNALILTMAGETYQPGYLLVDPPLIRSVGPGEMPAGMASGSAVVILDADGGWLMPGMIDAHCHVGIYNDGLAVDMDDGNEMTDPISPQLRAIDGIFQDDRCFAEALAAGVTGAMTGPGSANVLAGNFAFLRTRGRTVESMAIRPAAAMKAAFGENPKKVYGKKDKTPSTRMATAALLREALEKARHYRQEKEKSDAGDEKRADFEINPRWEALLPVLSGEMMMKIHAHRTDDILTAIRIANEYGLRYTLEHCTEGYLIADLLAAEYLRGQEEGHGRGKPGLGRLEGIVAGPLLSDRSKPELSRANIANPGILSKAGVPVALMTDHPVLPIQYLPVSAAIAVRAGMQEEHALEAVTINAAHLCDAADRLGSLEPGKQADMVLFSGFPLDFRSRVRWVICQGEMVFQEETGA